MRIKILIDMNLSPQWVKVVKENEIDAVYWSEIGNPKKKRTRFY